MPSENTRDLHEAAESSNLESMFTGLVEEVGKVLEVEPREGTTRVRIAAPSLAGRLKLGDSIAVSGVCLTALAITPEQFEADLAQETIARTSLSRLKPGAAVNLELPTPAGTPLGGHVVQGHVDSTGRLLSLAAVAEGANGQTDWILQIAVPANLSRYIVNKGSITVEGISLTVAALERTQNGESTLTIAIIPHTYGATNLHTLSAGDEVNLEVDVLAKYAEQQTQLFSKRAETITERLLIAQGY